MNKKVVFTKKPSSRSNDGSTLELNDWVENRNLNTENKKVVAIKSEEPVKKLSLDIPVSLHTRIKVKCASEGIKIGDKIREILTREF